MKTICIIPARGGSKGLPGKNIKLLAGKPLIYWPIKAALSCNLIDKVFVTTDSEQIADAAIKAGADVPFLRNSSFAEDFTTTELTLQNALLSYEDFTKVKFDICVFLTATDIFRQTDWINYAIQSLINDSSIDSAFSVNETTKNYWHINDNFEYERILPWMKDYSSRQIRKSIFREDTGLCCATRANLWRSGRRIGDKVLLIPNKETQTYIDIHTDFDLFLAEKAIEYFKINNPEKVKLFL